MKFCVICYGRPCYRLKHGRTLLCFTFVLIRFERRFQTELNRTLLHVRQCIIFLKNVHNFGRSLTVKRETKNCLFVTGFITTYAQQTERNY